MNERNDHPGGAMAQAFRKAGIGSRNAGTRGGSARAAGNPAAAPERRVKADDFARAVAGATRIEVEERVERFQGRRDRPGRSRTGGAPAARVLARPTTQGRSGAAAPAENRNAATRPRGRGEQAPVTFRTLPDGQRQVVIRGGAYLQLGRPRAGAPNAVPGPQPQLEVGAATRINPALVRGDDRHRVLAAAPTAVGRTAPDASAGEVELVIGLDFGTAYCKVVVQEPDSGRAWAVPFTDDVSNPYLLSSTVWQDGATLNLAQRGRRLGNLKVPLLRREATASHRTTVIGFLALVLGHAKAWFLEQKADEFPGMQPFWSAHLGLPARDFEDAALVRDFEEMLWTALLLSGQPSGACARELIEQESAQVRAALTSGDAAVATSGGGTVHRDQIGIFPEIAAQIYGYLKSDVWDRALSTFLLVDIGGGTVDASVFHVEDDPAVGTVFVFLSAAVDNLGVYILHSQRLTWHVEQLERQGRCPDLLDTLKALRDDDVMPSAVPDTIDRYLEGARYPERTGDDAFRNRFAGLIWDQVIQGAAPRIQPGGGLWNSLPLLLCGGGRAIGLYGDFVQRINDPNSATTMGLRQLSMAQPRNLEGPGIGEDVYHRLSVAYGLSFLEIGETVTPENLPAVPSRMEPPDRSDLYVGAEQM